MELYASLVLGFNMSSKMLCGRFRGPLFLVLCRPYTALTYSCYLTYLLLMIFLMVTSCAGLCLVCFAVVLSSQLGCSGSFPFFFPSTCWKLLLQSGWAIMPYPLVLSVAPVWSEQPIDLANGSFGSGSGRVSLRSGHFG